MSEPGTTLFSDDGRTVAKHVIGATAALAGLLPGAGKGNSVVLEVFLLEPGRGPQTYQFQNLWVGPALSTEAAAEILRAYCNELANTRLTATRLTNTTRISIPCAGHSLSGKIDGQHRQILTIVAGLRAATCRQLAQFTTAGLKVLYA